MKEKNIMKGEIVMKSKLKHLSSIFILLAFIMISSMAVRADAATIERIKVQPKLSQKQLTINKGEKKKIVLKKAPKKAISKIKWTSSDKSVATVSTSKKKKNTCIVKATGSGTAVIKVKCNRKTYRCKVTVNDPEENRTTREIVREVPTEAPDTTVKTTEKATVKVTTETTPTQEKTTEKTTTEQEKNTETTTEDNPDAPEDLSFTGDEIYYSSETQDDATFKKYKNASTVTDDKYIQMWDMYNGGIKIKYDEGTYTLVTLYNGGVPAVGVIWPDGTKHILDLLIHQTYQDLVSYTVFDNVNGNKQGYMFFSGYDVKKLISKLIEQEKLPDKSYKLRPVDSMWHKEVATEDTTENIATHNHNWDSWITVKSPDCEQDGVEKRVCLECGKEETAEIKATGHQWDKDVVIQEASSTESGIIKHTCLTCGEISLELIPPKGVVENPVEAATKQMCWSQQPTKLNLRGLFPSPVD